MSQMLDEALDLSVRARRGEASDADLKRLKLALGASATLQVAHRAGTDFDVELAVKATDAELLDDIVAGALERAAGAKMPAISRPRFAVWLAAAAALLVSAGAFGWWQTRPALPKSSVPQLRPALSTPPHRVEPSAQSQPVVTVPPEPRLEQAPTPAPPVANTMGTVPLSAQALFAKANRARSSQRSQEAIDLYRLLQKNHPSSVEALTSRVALGRLLLARGDHAAALTELDRQLSSGGALAEEALLWRARTLKEMGDLAAEQQAYRLLLERFPNTAYEQEASNRLGQ